MEETGSSRVVGREACPDCGSKDNLARYEDGSAYCYTPDCKRFEKGNGESIGAPRAREDSSVDWIDGEVRAIPRRRLTEETAKKFDYRVADYKGQKVQVATYWKDGARVFQKVRTADKRFWGVGDEKAALFGQHLWPATGRRLVITEGEVDAMSVAQAFGLTWPAVSVPGGAGNALAAIKRELRWIEGYDEVVIWFDNDEPGRKAAEECARAIKPGKVKLAFAPEGFKDASDMLMANDVKGLCRVVYDARAWRPEGLVSISDIRDRVLAPVDWGAPWPWEGLTKATFGRRPGEVYGFGAGTGVGKTDLFTQIIAHDVTTLRVPCGVLYLEQPVGETGKRVAGKIAGKRFHIPDGSWTQDELVAAVATLESGGQLRLFDAFGATSWSVIKSMIRYMIVGLGLKHIFLDHLTALAAESEDENAALKVIMAELAGMAQETGAVIHYISHLSTPEGKPHEEGGRVMIRHFRGSRAIGFWTHFMFGLERNQQADNEEERSVSILRCLKDRNTGNATGTTWALRYDRATGLLSEDANAMPPVRQPRDRNHGDF